MPRVTDNAMTVRMPQELHDRLRERADAEDRSVAQVIRLAANLYLAGGSTGVSVQLTNNR